MNLSSNNSTLNNTEAKKIAALARHHRFQAEVTPRTAIRNFVEANQSEAQTPSNFFSQNPDSEVRSGTRRSLRQSKNGSDEATQNTTTEADNSNLPSDNSDLNDTRTLRRSSRGKRKHGVTAEEVDLERDLTRPTNVSATVNMSSFQLSDDSTDQTPLLRNKRQSQKERVKPGKHFSEEDFNITLAKTKTNQSKAGNETLGKTVAQMDQSTNDSLVISEKMARRRKLLERKQSRKKETTTWDFTGIEAPSPKIPDVVEDRPNTAPDVATTESEGHEHEQEDVDAEPGKEPESPRLEFSSFEDQTLVRQRPKKSKVGISAGDFSDITVTSPNKSDASAEMDDHGEVEKSCNKTKDDTLVNSPVPVSAEAEEADTVLLENNEEDEVLASAENTPERRSARSRVTKVNSVDFDDITLTSDQKATNAQSAVAGEVTSTEQDISLATKSPRMSLAPKLVNTPSPSVRRFTNVRDEEAVEEEVEEETLENIEKFVQNTGNRERRKSMYQAGLPNAPVENSMVLENTKVFRPEVESTRIANASNVSKLSNSVFDSTHLGLQSPMAAKPGRDTSTPCHTETRAGQRARARGLSRTEVVAAANTSDAGPRMNKTAGAAHQQQLQPITEIDPHLPTPQIMEVIREARKSGVRSSMRVSMHAKSVLPAEDFMEGGTQTSPGFGDQLEVPEENPGNMETGCQVTPGLEATDIGQRSTMSKSMPNKANSSSNEKRDTSSRNATVAGFSISTEESLEKAAHRRSEINDIVNSLNEEVNIDLPAGEENEDTLENGLDITSSGRKNPSPLVERRNEVEVDITVNETHDEEVDEDQAEDEESVAGAGPGHVGKLPQDVGSTHLAPDTAEVVTEEEEEEEDNVDISAPADRSLDYLQLPSPSQSKSLPSSQERREMRQATLTRYLGTRDPAASPLAGSTPAISPAKKPPPQAEKPKPKQPRKPKAQPKSVFPAKNIKFEYHRFSRFKLKPAADNALVASSEAFIKQCMEKMSGFAAERGAEKIHMCDIKRMMAECGFVKPEEEDPNNRDFYYELREVAKDRQVAELIPCSKGAGVTYPPKDVWDIKGGKKKAKVQPVKSGASIGSGKGSKKADKVRRLKVKLKRLVLYLSLFSSF